MLELNSIEIDEVNGGVLPSVGMAVVSGILWVAAEMAVAVPPVAASLALGAAVVATGAAIAAATGN